MKTLHVMVGLPRSGKSTLARELGHPIVCPDAIRIALHGTPWRAEVEPMVWAMAHLMVDTLFGSGHDHVILDACNHTEKRRSEWVTDRWRNQYHVVDTPAPECIRRAILTGQDYLIPVIERMSMDCEPLGGKTDC